MESRSLVEICGTYRTKCGYCKRNTKTSVSYGLLAKRLTCADYQDLIDRGWRRSGTFVYKPIMHETCCPQYTIRLDTTRFKHTKAQRHVLNRLRRYLNGDTNIGSSASGSQGAASGRKASSSAGGGKADSREKEKSGGLSRGSPNGNDVSANGGTARGSSDILNVFSHQVATAALSAVEGDSVSGLSLLPEWRSEIMGWSQVKRARNKKISPSGGGFCSTVALRIASAARKRGWKGVGASGGAVTIAEAIAGRLREGGNEETEPTVLSSVAVAPNGFINFEARSIPPCSSASPDHVQIPPPRPHEARDGGAPPLSATPPSPPAQRSSLRGNIPAGDGGASSERARLPGAYPTSLKPVLTQGKRAGEGGSSAGWKATNASSDKTEDTSAALGKEAVLLTEVPSLGKMGTAVGQRNDGAFTTAHAQIEWVEKQGKNDGMMDVEASSAAPSRGAGLETSSAEPRTGLGSLPPLGSGVEPHRMTVSTVPARLTDEVFQLYVKYQVSVHGDEPSEVTPDQFCRFLVDSPLIRETISGTIVRQRKPGSRHAAASRSERFVDDDAMEVAVEDECSEITQGHDSLSVPYGSYHQLYRIDGRLVAVGVVDILPKCLSSVYCFYDPDYRALALGKLTALKETDFVREAHAIRPALRDYYMGFYIHTCPKMSYKGSYTPSSLLCPERLTWVPLELCRPVLDVHKYARLSDLLEPSLLGTQPPDALSGEVADVNKGNQSGGSNSTTQVRGSRGSAVPPSAADMPGRGHEASSERTGASPPTGQTLAGSGSPLSSLSPDRRDVGQGRPRDVLASSRARPVPGGGRGRSAFGSSGSSDRTTEVGAAMAARKAAAERAAAARAARAAEDAASGINDIPLMVGHPTFLVNLPELTPQSQALVRDVLSSYVATIGSDLAMRLVLKLHD
ncbi:unnamed protein product [Scytosiphon promiscuus]